MFGASTLLVVWATAGVVLTGGVRPFWIGRREKVRETLKLESRYQKNKQPFLIQKCQDKYKGTKYYDRR